MEGNTSVIVPDLGCFTIVAKPSVIQNNIVIPPVKTVEFDGENSEDNHVFTGYLAKKENISMEQAVQEVSKFYEHFFTQKLAKFGQPIVFEKFGTFSLNDFRDIQFVPVADFFKDNYGLGQAHISTTPPSEPKPPVQETKPPPPKEDESLFAKGDTTRYRENTDRRRPAIETPPVQPPKQSKPPQPPPKPFKSPKPPKPPKPPRAKRTGNSNLWVLWVLLVAAGLGVAGYYFYPNIDNFIANKNSKGKPATIIAEPEVKPEDTGVTDEDTTNSGVAQSLDEATDKRNALNPAGSQPTEVARTPTTPTTSTPTTSSTPSTPSRPVTQSQSSAGSGNWALVAGSFKVQANAESYQKTLQAEGYSTEIILAKNNLYWVSIGSFNTLAEAQRQANQVSAKRDVWIGRK